MPLELRFIPCLTQFCPHRHSVRLVLGPGVECSPKQSELLQATAPSLWFYQSIPLVFLFFFRELISETEHHRYMQLGPNSFS